MPKIKFFFGENKMVRLVTNNAITPFFMQTGRTLFALGVNHPKTASLLSIAVGAAMSKAIDYYFTTSSEIKKERDYCVRKMDLLEEHLNPNAKNSSNLEPPSTLFYNVIENIRVAQASERIINTTNERIKNMWNQSRGEVIEDMKAHGISYEVISLDNPENAAASLASFIEGSKLCYSERATFNKELSKCIKEKEALNKELINEKDKKDLVQDNVHHLHEKVEVLVERKGECKELENIKAENDILKDKKHELEKQFDNLKKDKEHADEKYEALEDRYKELKEQYDLTQQRWFFRRWTGL